MPSKPSHPSFDYTAAESAIIATLGPDGLLTEFRTLGVKISGPVRPSGRAECYSCLREDGSPSAYVDVNAGTYKDSGGEDSHEIKIWQLAADLGKWAGDWKKAREYYAELAGVVLPGMVDPNKPNTHNPRKQRAKRAKKGSGKQAGIPRAAEKVAANAAPGLRGGGESVQPAAPTTTAEDWHIALTFHDWDEGTDRLLAHWCRNHKPGITPEAFKLTGGRFATYTKSGVKEDGSSPWEIKWNVFCVPIYGPELLKAEPVGWCCWSRNPIGDPLTKWNKTTHTAEPIKMKTIGSADGLIGEHALRVISSHALTPTTTPTIEHLWKVEGPTDLLTLISSQDAATRDTAPTLTAAGGAKSFNPWMADVFAPHRTYVIGDADVPGEAGADKACSMIADAAAPLHDRLTVTRARLPYTVEPKHGKDLRDYLLAGNQYGLVYGLATFDGVAWEPGRGGCGLAGEGVNGDDSDDSDSDDSNTTSSAAAAFDPTSITCESGRTETASARRFIAANPDALRYCQPWKSWYFWDGKRWKSDKECHVQGLAKSYAESLWHEIERQQADEHLAAEIEKFAKRSNTRVGVENIMLLARSEPGIPVQPEQFDNYHTLLNVENGVLDLTTGQLRPHDPTLMLSKLAPVTFDPQAECPTWLKFIAEITAPVDDPASMPFKLTDEPQSATGDAYEPPQPPTPPEGMLVKDYLQRLAGWCLTGLIRTHAMPFFYGKGSNGKSTFLNVLLELLGNDYAMKAPPELIMAKNRDSHPTERADLHGKRMVITNEVEEGRRLAEGLVKDLTGSDSIRARRMNEDFWEFKPTHKLIVAGNYKPVVKGMDEGLWRRIKLVPFNRKFEGHEKDETLPDKLTAELPGILNWCLAGCLAWMKDGLPEPAIVSEATKEYRSEQDVFGNYLLERCVVGTWAKVKSGDLYADYSAWCETSGERAMTMKKFGLTVIEDKRFSRRTSNGVWYDGIGLRATPKAKNDTQNSSEIDADFSADDQYKKRASTGYLPL